MSTPALSIIFITRNSLREKHFCIGYALQSVLYQSIRDFEVLVVDDASSDGTPERVSALYPDARLILTDSEDRNLSRLRNRGAESANGAVLLFMDDDTVLTDKHDLRRLLQLIPDYSFMCGAKRFWTHLYWHRHVSLNQSFSSTLNTLRSLSILPRGINRASGFRDLNEFTMIGNFGMVHRTTFNDVGGFNEVFTDWGLEDTELMMRLCRGGFEYRLLYSDVGVMHLNHVADTRSDYLRNLRIFNEMEIENRCSFHLNHFFRVYEGDGYSLFTAH